MTGFAAHPYLQLIGKPHREFTMIIQRIKAARVVDARPALSAADEKRRRKAEKRRPA